MANLMGPAGQTLAALLSASVIRDYLGQPLHFVCHIVPEPDSQHDLG